MLNQMKTLTMPGVILVAVTLMSAISPTIGATPESGTPTTESLISIVPCDPTSFCSACIATCVGTCLEKGGNQAIASCVTTEDQCLCQCTCKTSTAELRTVVQAIIPGSG